jgi:hypothetical protein
MIISRGYGREELPAALAGAGLLIGAEIGVQSGQNAERLLIAGVQRLYLVDQWSQEAHRFNPQDPHDVHHDANLRETIARMRHFPFKVTVILGPSDGVAKFINDESLDFVYIDAAHDYHSVSRDLTAWIPKVRKGGWVCGHDLIDNETTGVKTAVFEAVKRLGVEELFVAEEQTPNWHFVRV